MTEYYRMTDNISYVVLYLFGLLDSVYGPSSLVKGQYLLCYKINVLLGKKSGWLKVNIKS